MSAAFSWLECERWLLHCCARLLLLSAHGCHVGTGDRDKRVAIRRSRRNFAVMPDARALVE